MEYSGNVYWITGLSGAGKTTIGRKLYEHLKIQHDNIVFLDGEETRKVFGGIVGYTPADRMQVCMRNARLCKLLSDQGIHVICSTICLIADVQKWCGENISAFHQIVLDVRMEVLRKRKTIYEQTMRNEVKNVVGADVEPHYPDNPFITIPNNGEHNPEEIVAELITHLPKL